MSDEKNDNQKKGMLKSTLPNVGDVYHGVLDKSNDFDLTEEDMEEIAKLYDLATPEEVKEGEGVHVLPVERSPPLWRQRLGHRLLEPKQVNQADDAADEVDHLVTPGPRQEPAAEGCAAHHPDAHEGGEGG